MTQIDSDSPDDAKTREDAIKAPSGKLSDPRVLEQVEKYCRALEQGKSPDREQFLTQFPEIAEELLA